MTTCGFCKKPFKIGTGHYKVCEARIKQDEIYDLYPHLNSKEIIELYNAWFK